MVSPIIKTVDSLLGINTSAPTATPTATPAAAPAASSPIGTRTGTSAAGPSFLASAAAASTNNLAGGKSLLGQ